MDKRYLKFIEDNRVQQLDNGVDKHHIKPKHHGGSDDKDNICYLSRENHIKAHELLYEIYSNSTDKKVIGMLSVSALRGDILSDETRKKMSESAKGKPKSIEHRNKISKIRLGMNMSDAAREKISMALKGVKKPPRSAEHNRNQSIAQTGKKMSIEARKKMSESRKLYFEKRRMNEGE